MKIIAHRGDSKTHLENTFSAIQAAILCGAEIIEIDIRKTSDGHFVLMHYADIGKTTEGTGLVCNLSLDQIRSIRTLNGEKIPTLKEILSLVKNRAFLKIDIKESIVDNSLFELIQDQGMTEHVMFTSVFLRSLKKTRKFFPQVKIEVGWLNKKIPLEKILKKTRRVQADFIGPHHTIISKTLVDTAHKNGVGVHVWTVNYPEKMKAMIALGVDGITTDDPREAIQIRNSIQILKADK